MKKFFKNLVDSLLWYFNFTTTIEHNKCVINKEIFELHVEHKYITTPFSYKNYITFDIIFNKDTETNDYFKKFKKIVVMYDKDIDITRKHIKEISEGNIKSICKKNHNISTLYSEMDKIMWDYRYDIYIKKYSKIGKRPFKSDIGIAPYGTLFTSNSLINEKYRNKLFVYETKKRKEWEELKEKKEKEIKEKEESIINKKKKDSERNINSLIDSFGIAAHKIDFDEFKQELGIQKTDIKLPQPQFMQRIVIKPSGNGWYINQYTGEKYHGKKNIPKDSIILDINGRS